MGNSTVQWRGAIGSYAAKICSNSWMKNCTTGASAGTLELSEMLVARILIREEARAAFSWLNILFTMFIMLAVVGVLVWGARLTKMLVLINLPGAGKLLYASLKNIEDYLIKNGFELWSLAMESLEKLSFFVLIQFAFIDIPNEILSENFTCKTPDFQCGAGGCEAGFGVKKLGVILEVFTRQLIGLLLVMAGDVEVNPGPPSTLMEGLVELVAEAPPNLKPIIGKWDAVNDATKNRKVIDKATDANSARELLAFLWNTDLDNDAIKAFTKKEEVVYQVLVALENLLPETCGKCTNVYTVKREENPSLRCALCKQGFHEVCLGPEVKASLAGIKDFLPGKFRWLCPGCEKHLCSSSTVVGRKRDPVVEPPTDARPGGETVEAEHPLTAPPPPLPPPPPIRLMIRTNETGEFEAFHAPASPNIDENSDARTRDNVEDIEQMRRINDSVSTNGNIVRNGTEQLPVAESTRPICGYFLKSICRHGFVGRGCKDRHPKYCKVFRTWGSSGEKGCKGGKTCQNGSHPLMCKDSMTKLKCENVNCSAKIHAIKCVRARPGMVGAGSNTAANGRGGESAAPDGRDHGVPRNDGRWPRDRRVWDTPPRTDHQERRSPSQENGDHHGTGFRERHNPQVGQPPPEMVGFFRRELMLQQQQFQQQLILQVEQMLSRVQGGGKWPNPTPYNY